MEARAFLKLLGWDLPPGLDDIGLAALNLNISSLRSTQSSAHPMPNGTTTWPLAGRIADLALAIEALTQQIHQLAQTLPARLASFGDYVERTQIHKELPRRLFDFLAANFLAQASPLTYASLHLLNIIDYPYCAADPTGSKSNTSAPRSAITSSRWRSLARPTFTEAYGWHTPDFRSMTFLTRLVSCCKRWGYETVSARGVRRRKRPGWASQISSTPAAAHHLPARNVEPRSECGWASLFSAAPRRRAR